MFVPNQDLKDSILSDYPVSSNINKPKILDDFFKELLEEKKKNLELGVDEIMEKAQQEALNIMGPLSKVWLTL